MKKRKIFLWWAILVLVLACYERIFSYLGIDKTLFYIRDVFNVFSVSLFIVYIILVLLGITFLFKNRKNRNILLELGVILFSLIILALWWPAGGLTALVSYYLLAAFTEESFKFTVSNNQSEVLSKKEVSSLLLLAILMGISFSLSENLLAFFMQIFQWETLTTSFILWRWLIAALIHAVATGTIALVLMKIKKWGILLRYFIALLLWFAIHIAYNLALLYGLSRLVVLLAIASFIRLTYLIFHIDELYMK